MREGTSFQFPKKIEKKKRKRREEKRREERKADASATEKLKAWTLRLLLLLKVVETTN